jgi:hypothetical protein
LEVGPNWQYKQEYEQFLYGILLIPRLRPRRREGTGPNVINKSSPDYKHMPKINITVLGFGVKLQENFRGTSRRRNTYYAGGGVRGMTLKRYGMDLLVAGIIYALGFLSACFWWRNQLHDLRVRVEDCQKQIQYFQDRDAELERRPDQIRKDKNCESPFLLIPDYKNIK